MEVGRRWRLRGSGVWEAVECVTELCQDFTHGTGEGKVGSDCVEGNEKGESLDVA